MYGSGWWTNIRRATRLRGYRHPTSSPRLGDQQRPSPMVRAGAGRRKRIEKRPLRHLLWPLPFFAVTTFWLTNSNYAEGPIGARALVGLGFMAIALLVCTVVAATAERPAWQRRLGAAAYLTIPVWLLLAWLLSG